MYNYRFPKDLIREELYTKAVRREDWTPTDNSRLCSVHFEDRHFDKTSLSIIRLRNTAVSTIFPAFPAYLQQVILNLLTVLALTHQYSK